MTAGTKGLHWRLAAVTAVVLGVHLLALVSAPVRIRPGERHLAPASFQIRSINPAPAAPLSEPVGVPAAAAAPQAPRQALRPRPAHRPAPAEFAPDLPLRRVSTVAEVAPPPPADPSREETVAVREVPAPTRVAQRAGAAPAVAIPAPMRLHYRVAAKSRGLNWQAQGELLWRHDGKDYEARLKVSAPLLPSRTQLSTGRITSQGLAPTRFSDRSRREEAAHFVRDQGKISFSNNQPDAPLSAGAQDRLSVMLQLGGLLAGQPARYPAGTTISIQTASTREAELWLFKVEGEEELKLPGGTVRTLKLVRLPRKEFDQKIELWLAPGMDYVPARVRLTQPNGDWLDQQWSATDRG